MLTARKRSNIKRFAAAAAAVLMSVTVFGAYGQQALPAAEFSAVSGYADEEDAAAEYERQMRELDLKKRELDERIAKAGDDIAGKQEKLDAVNEKAATLKKKIKKVSAKAEELENEMADLDMKMRETGHQVKESEQQLSEGIDSFKGRLRALYIAGNDSYTEVVLNSGSFYDVLMRFELVMRVAKHDSDAIDELVAQKEDLDKHQAKLDKQSKALKAKSAEYSEKQRQLAEQQAELLQMQNEYGTAIEELSGDLSDYYAQAGLVYEEYAAVSEKARLATTTTTTTAAETTTVPDDEDNSDNGGSESSSKKKKAKTTKKDTSQEENVPEPVPDDGGEDDDPYYYDEPETTTTTQAPVTAAPTTTTKKKTTTAAPDPAPASDDRESKVSIVVNYAKGMVGGSYVWAGEQYGATDCSGLVMLSYRQVGIELPHLASSQAEYGTSVSYDELMPGDLVFFGSGGYSSIYHVAMYIGNGKIVHAESTDTGIVISYLSSVAQYNPICCMKRLL